MRWLASFLLLTAALASARAQTRDAGPIASNDASPTSDAGVADAGLADDAGVADAAAAIADASPSAPVDLPREPSREELEERARIERAERAEAVSLQLIREEDERLHEIERAQQRFHEEHLVCPGAGGKPLEELEQELASLPNDGARYLRVSDELEATQMHTLRAWNAVWEEPPPAPSPGASLSRNLATLPDAFATEFERLESTRQRLHDNAAALDRDLAHHLDSCAYLLYQRESGLMTRRQALFASIGDKVRRAILDYRDHTADEVRVEAVHLYIEVLHWLDRRSHDISQSQGLLVDFAFLGHILWWLLEIGLALLVMNFARKRWDGWMVGAADIIGNNLHLGGWTLMLVRFTDAARSFGPALLVLGTAMFIHRQLGGGDAAPEVRVAYVFVFWMALMRAQQRLLERVARHIGNWLVERAAREKDYEPDDFQDATSGNGATPTAAAARADQAGDEPAVELFVHSWLAVTRYATAAFISLELVILATGHAVSYHLARVLVLWGLLPLGIYCLRVWRPWIVREYVKRSAQQGWLTALTQKHGHRFYGLLVLALALIIVLVRQTARFAKSNLSNLDTTKRLLAFLFRRRVEKHALESGAFLAKMQDLPADLLAEFPTGPLDPSGRPVKPPFLDTIKQAFTTWQAEQMEGSVVLVGGPGMGKSTALRLLQGTLEEPVPVYKVVERYTEPQALIAGLARLLELPRIPTDESTFIAELTRHLEGQGRRVVALDNCHNFFLRKVGGFAAWDAFTRIVNQSCHKVFWVMSFNAASWDYLNNIAAGVAYFRRVVHIPPWTDEELRRLILTRMRRAGYRVNFTDLLVTRMHGVRATNQIIRTSQGYFRLLWDFTDGNPRVACHFWLRSLVPDADKKRARVHLFAAPRIEELEQLPDEIAFVLAALVEHESITAEELATVSNTSLDFARFALQYCREHGYMWRTLHTDRTKLSTHWQQSIIRYLKRRHLLYS